MNARDNVLGALALIESVISRGFVTDGSSLLGLSMACAALRRANEELRPPSCAVCGGYGCEMCSGVPELPDNVIQLFPGATA